MNNNLPVDSAMVCKNSAYIAESFLEEIQNAIGIPCSMQQWIDIDDLLTLIFISGSKSCHLKLILKNPKGTIQKEAFIGMNWKQGNKLLTS